MRRRTTDSRTAGALAALLLMVGACGSDQPAEGGQSLSAGEADPVYADRLETAGALSAGSAYTWGSTKDLEQADAVVVGTITAERLIELNPDPNTYGREELARELTLSIESVIEGDLEIGSQYRFISTPAFRGDDGEVRRTAAYRTLVLKGDRVLVALVGPGNLKETDNSGPLTLDSVLFLDGEEVIDTGREKPIIQELESMTLDEVRQRIERDVDQTGQRTPKTASG